MSIRRNGFQRYRKSPQVILILIMAVAVAVFVLGVFMLSRLFADGGQSPSQAETTPTTGTVSAEDDGDVINADGMTANKGWFLNNEKAYYGTDDNQVYVGDHKIDGVSYQFDGSGALVNGWIQIENLRYHFKDGVMSKGATEIDGKTYQINSDGSMFVGWYDAANGYRLYYDLETGDPFIGWHEIDGKHYCFDTTGFLYTDTDVDGIPVDENGVADEKTYQKHIGSVSSDTTTTTLTKIDTQLLNKKLDDILSKYGKSPRNIYDYVHDHYTYKHADEGSIQENALYLLENGTGSCYHFASLTYMLFERAGYETRYVTGLGWQNHTYHCWIMAKFDGGWYFVDSLYVRSAKLTADDLKRIGYEWNESAYPTEE